MRERAFQCVFIAFVVLTLFQTQQFIAKALPTIVDYFDARGDHDVIRDRKIPYHRAILEASRLVPPGESVSFPRSQLRMIDVIAIRYALYPARVKDQGHYVIAFHEKDGFVYTQVTAPRGNPFCQYQPGLRSRLKELAAFVLTLFMVAFIGMNLLSLLGIGPYILGRVWFWSTAHLVGFVAVNGVYWALLMVGFALDGMTVKGIALVILISTFMLRRIYGRPSIDVSHPKDEHFSSVPWEWCGQAFLLCVAILVVLVTIAIPLTVWDEMLIWIMRAKMLFYDGIIDFNYLEKTHVYYPNLWPLHIHLFFQMIGGCFSEGLKWVCASVFLSFAGQLYGLSRLSGGNKMYACAVVGGYTVLFMNFIFFTALPENIFMALSLGIVIAMSLWFSDGQRCRYLILAFILAIGLSGVKFEGGVAVMFLVMSAALARLPKSDFSIKKISGLVCVLMTGTIPWLWMYWLKSHGYEYSIYHFAGRFVWPHAVAIVDVIMRSILQPKNLIMLFVMALSAIVVANYRPCNFLERFIGLAALMFTIFAMSAVIFWPVNDIQLYYPEVLDRLFLRATPFIMVLWASRVFYRKPV